MVVRVKASGTEIACKNSWHLMACEYSGNENGNSNCGSDFGCGYPLVFWRLNASLLNPLG